MIRILTFLLVLTLAAPAYAQEWLEGRVVVNTHPILHAFTVADDNYVSNQQLREAGLEAYVEYAWTIQPGEWAWVSLAHLGLPPGTTMVYADVVFRASGTSFYQYCGAYLTVRPLDYYVHPTMYKLAAVSSVPQGAYAENGSTWIPVRYIDGEPGIEILWDHWAPIPGAPACYQLFRVQIPAAFIAD